AAAGRYSIVVTATNEDALTVSDTFTLTITSFVHGDGSALDPWQISTTGQLDEIRLYPDAHFELVADIDLSSTDWQPIGDYTHAFSGSFNGNGHAIRGLTVNVSEDEIAGLFGVVSGAEIHSLALLDAVINGGESSGILAGFVSDSVVTQVH